ncbi:hypothetical protein J2S36_001347 [Arcanobacterium hippocoleae]|uniref:GH84 domain-containing protein n=2 Tax=Arcanobacterium hippocoleae TaxID=149017 RepID=A0ABU1T343_9ACTO|nr:beta-N-acetylglucosaminidase domain-containing protein [Arcanobacterium hippocoleae]MDR6939804.1 hypothetical protein [Arcanobacterium hippocoleae]
MENLMRSQRMRKFGHIFAVMTVFAFIFSTIQAPVGAVAAENVYQLYPTPQDVKYGEGVFTLDTSANVVVEDGIDPQTQARLDEVLKLKNIKKAGNQLIKEPGKTQILVGIKDSGKAVDEYVKTLKREAGVSFSPELFSGAHHQDAYFLATIPGENARPNTIVILGKDTDAAFYGLTTLYRIFQQMPQMQVRVLTIEDYADVITRGFIEGYYGEPWSTEDRVELMRWGGYQKLNAYVYAPKDDPKHNAQWRTLYTPEELTNKIDPLAKAGNDSKVRFVYALHPFMNKPITAKNYDESVEILKQKFTQVMDHGVRQIAILADDAPSQGAALYTRLLSDMTKWLEQKQAEQNPDGTVKYPGLKKTLIFCPVAYYGFGEPWYKDLPANVQVVNTGGRVWGKVDNKFVTRFQQMSRGRSPFMWINWPCSDNDKNALHMGGHNSFLGSDVRPGSVEGVVLNPMQQSEPSKHAIFMNADFTWNLWSSERDQGKQITHADQAWEDSFSYVDHNSPIASESAKALRNLSEHMRRIFGGGVVFENNESASVKDQILEFQTKAVAGTATSEEVAAIAKIFAALAKDAQTYRAQAGTPRMLAQIQPWIDAWDDFTTAAAHFLKAYQAMLSSDERAMVAEYSAAKNAMDAYGKHGFSYIKETQYAKVGKMYLAPMLDVLANKLAEKVVLAAGPEADLTAYITSRSDAPDGGASATAAYDGSVATKLIYKSPNKLDAGTYFGLLKSKPFDLTSVKFVQGNKGGKDFIEFAKLQVFDGKQWVDVAKQDNLTGATVAVYDLAEKNVYGVRLIAKSANTQDAWPTIAEIVINPEKPVAPVPGVISSPSTVVYQNNAARQANDGDEESLYWFHNSGGNYVNETNPLVLTFAEQTKIDRVLLMQGPKDRIGAGTLEYSADGTNEWKKLADVSNAVKQKFDFPAVLAKAVRVRPDKQYPIWWQVAEFNAYAAVAAPAPDPQPAPEPQPAPGLDPAPVPNPDEKPVQPSAPENPVDPVKPVKPAQPDPAEKQTAPEEPKLDHEKVAQTLKVNGVSGKLQLVRGENIELLVDSLPVGTQVVFELHSTPIVLGKVTADNSGVARLRAAIPSSVSAGEHDLFAKFMLNGKSVVLKQAVTIADPQETEVISKLAKTGSGLAGLLVVAVLVGIAGVRLTRRGIR